MCISYLAIGEEIYRGYFKRDVVRVSYKLDRVVAFFFGSLYLFTTTPKKKHKKMSIRLLSID